MFSHRKVRLFMETTSMLTRGAPDSGRAASTILLGSPSRREKCDRHKHRPRSFLWPALPHANLGRDGSPLQLQYLECYYVPDNSHGKASNLLRTVHGVRSVGLTGDFYQ